MPFGAAVKRCIAQPIDFAQRDGADGQRGLWPNDDAARIWIEFDDIKRVGHAANANALALASYIQPYHAIFAHTAAHIAVDECGAPEFYSGAKLALVPGAHGKMSPDTLAAALARVGEGGVHGVQRGMVSLTNVTEAGTVYNAVQTAALAGLARAKGMPVHLDGARFANAVAALGCAPADISWRAGVDVLSFGFVKNGGMGAEALVYFDPGLADAARYRRKRAGHLQSKGRFLAAQLLAMLENDLWLTNARSANAAAQIIADAAAERLLYPVQANELFLRLMPAEAAALRGQGFDFYDWGVVDENWGAARLVTSWQHTEADVAPLARAIAAL